MISSASWQQGVLRKSCTYIFHRRPLKLSSGSFESNLLVFKQISVSVGDGAVASGVEGMGAVSTNTSTVIFLLFIKFQDPYLGSYGP